MKKIDHSFRNHTRAAACLAAVCLQGLAALAPTVARAADPARNHSGHSAARLAASHRPTQSAGRQLPSHRVFVPGWLVGHIEAPDRPRGEVFGGWQPPSLSQGTRTEQVGG